MCRAPSVWSAKAATSTCLLGPLFQHTSAELPVLCCLRPLHAAFSLDCPGLDALQRSTPPAPACRLRALRDLERQLLGEAQSLQQQVAAVQALSCGNSAVSQALAGAATLAVKKVALAEQQQQLTASLAPAGKFDSAPLIQQAYSAAARYSHELLAPFAQGQERHRQQFMAAVGTLEGGVQSASPPGQQQQQAPMARPPVCRADNYPEVSRTLTIRPASLSAALAPLPQEQQDAAAQLAAALPELERLNRWKARPQSGKCGAQQRQGKCSSAWGAAGVGVLMGGAPFMEVCRAHCAWRFAVLPIFANWPVAPNLPPTAGASAVARRTGVNPSGRAAAGGGAERLPAQVGPGSGDVMPEISGCARCLRAGSRVPGIKLPPLSLGPGRGRATSAPRAVAVRPADLCPRRWEHCTARGVGYSLLGQLPCHMPAAQSCTCLSGCSQRPASPALVSPLSCTPVRRGSRPSRRGRSAAGTAA